LLGFFRLLMFIRYGDRLDKLDGTTENN